jgi:hypothetical protein
MKALSTAFILVFVHLFSFVNSDSVNQSTTWKLNDTINIGGTKPVVLGAPQIVKGDSINGLLFDGTKDGLIVPVNPLQELKSFTIEILFKPMESTSIEPRMMHIQDEKGNRCTIELRLTSNGNWYLDTFLKNGNTNKGLGLIDSTKEHPCNEWYWVALTYDGTKMTSYVNSQKEGEGLVSLIPMTSGQTSLGVRLNKINWFRGQISEIRFHSGPLTDRMLQRM